MNNSNSKTGSGYESPTHHTSTSDSDSDSLKLSIENSPSPKPESPSKAGKGRVAWYEKVDRSSAGDNRYQPWVDDVGHKVTNKDILAYKKYDEADEKDLMWRGKRGDSEDTVSFAG